MYPNNSQTIAVDDFVNAIVTNCPHTTSFKNYIADLINSSSKGKNDKWINLCKTIRGSDEPVKRHWRVFAHKIFVDKIVDIERDLYDRLSFLNDPSNSEAIEAYLSYQLRKKKISESVIRCTREYLRLRSNCGALDISSELDCDDNNNFTDDGVEDKDVPDTQTAIASEDMVPDIQTGTVSEHVPESGSSLSSEDVAVAGVSEEFATEIEDQHPPKQAYRSKNKFFVIDPSYLNEKERKEVVSTAFKVAKEASNEEIIVQAILKLSTSDNPSFSHVKRDPRTPKGTPYSTSSSATISADESFKMLDTIGKSAASTSGKSSLDPTRPPIKPPAKPPSPPTGPPAGPRGSRSSLCESTSSSSSYSSPERFTTEPPRSPTKSPAKPLRSPDKPPREAKEPHCSSCESTSNSLSYSSSEPFTTDPTKPPIKPPAKPPRSPIKPAKGPRRRRSSSRERSSSSPSNSSSEPFTTDPTRPPIKPPAKPPRSPIKPAKGPRRRRSSSSDSSSNSPSNSPSKPFKTDPTRPPIIPRGPHTSSPKRKSRSPGGKRQTLQTGNSAKPATQLFETTPNESSRPTTPPPARPPPRPPIRPPNKPPNRPPGNRRDSGADDTATS
ncbi:nucleolar and coiled-body phosphoprotein 1 [Microplitis demolitor]|uniref:nucleolar and coiled-body phosphoprotein 1 n=1 Tax=Microplitis demolitor TaxID=69319 RepID=UPI0004CCE887|nr:nucleolar and coiled-body phosphoprotein 1 [Microplitis demolitor]